VLDLHLFLPRQCAGDRKSTQYDGDQNVLKSADDHKSEGKERARVIDSSAPPLRRNLVR
jgi:hypothetical protein